MARGEPAAWGVVVPIGTVTVVLLAALVWLLATMQADEPSTTTSYRKDRISPTVRKEDSMNNSNDKQPKQFKGSRMSIGIAMDLVLEAGVGAAMGNYFTYFR